jgi:hypothetical protein
MIDSNLLSLTGFKLSIHNSSDFKHTQYFAVSASFPSVSLPEVTTGYRNQMGYVPGDKLNYDPLTIRVAIDERLESYREIFGWLRTNVSATELKIHDITLHFLTNHNNISRSIRFANAFPTNMGGLEFNVQGTETEYAFVDITFRYDYFEFLT